MPKPKAKPKANNNNLAILLCTWQRPERFQTIIDMLSNQTTQEFTLFVHNNNPEIKGVVDSVLEGRDGEYQVEVKHAAENEGSWAFVELGKQAAKAGFGRVLILGDDNAFGGGVVEQLNSEYQAESIVGHYAWHFRRGQAYWRRDRVSAGELAHYIGSAGAIYDSALFLNDKIDDCPKQFRAVEDLWLSYLAWLSGWQLISSPTQIGIVNDGKDQYTGLIETKSEFLEYLRMKGWTI